VRTITGVIRNTDCVSKITGAEFYAARMSTQTFRRILRETGSTQRMMTDTDIGTLGKCENVVDIERGRKKEKKSRDEY